MWVGLSTLSLEHPEDRIKWSSKAGKLSAIRTLGGHRRYREAEVKELLGAVMPAQIPAQIPAQRSGRD